jgi:hypothetical protein
MPAGEVNVRARAGERLGDARKSRRAVDQDFDVATIAYLRLTACPEPVIVGVELSQPTDPPEPTAMVSADGPLKLVADPPVASIK